MHLALRRGLAAVALTTASTLAAAFPTRPVTIVVPAPPGGTADTVVRTVVPKLSAALGQPVLVENRAGASGMIASQHVAGAPADGHVVLMNYTSHAINPWLTAKMPYDSARAFAPVGFLGKVPLLLAVPSDGPKSAAELIATAKAKPGTMTYGSSATGGASHLGGELFSQLTGGKLTLVGYKGGAAAATDLAAGRISMLLDSQLALNGLQQAGRIRYLGVASEKPSAAFPELPPIGRELPGFEATAWYGLMAPAGTPAAAIERLNAELNRVLADPADGVAGLEQRGHGRQRRRHRAPELHQRRPQMPRTARRQPLP
ncbi:MAG TPA: tripartite tricarboxylate transporter substrate-binding protein, partial [Burkholderiaceae bacterium]|nr:tripartite tricarboxylate transporter substrate-binding protein [Burkholderiaceae bacterium]